MKFKLTRKWILVLWISIGICFQGYSQSCDITLLEVRQVRASDTDPNIPWELYQHYVYYNPACIPKNILLIYMVGTYGSPVVNQLFPGLAANYGFHVISLKYPNNIYASQVCADDSNIDCYKNYRHEALYGEDVSPGITIDTTNSILNRTLKLLLYLDQTYPSENWGQYLSGTSLIWSKVIASGHSQGSGHAAFMGHQFELSRVLMFAGPNEYSTFFNAQAEWLSQLKATSDSNYYSFGNTNDEIADFSSQLMAWSSLGMSPFGDSIDVDINYCPYNNHRILYTSQLFTGGISVNHGSVISDDQTPLDANGLPVFTPVWKYLLGVCGSTTSIMYYPSASSIELFPNPVTHVMAIKFKNTNHNPMRLIIYDNIGRETIRIDNITNNQINIDMSALYKGVYFYSLTNMNHQERTSGSFIKVK